jgi:predicted Ser/Thr protein kinase
MQTSESGADSFLRAVAAAPFISLPGHFTGTERFELVRLLGEGGFGQVFEAIDHRHGGRVALKVLRRTDGLYNFKREFRSLAELLHPNLVRLYELVSVDQSWFFTMELIDGVPLLEFAATNEWNLRDAFGQLAKGLMALHRAGIMHRDVKPSNVLVDHGGRAVLLDFGLAVEVGATLSNELAGTPHYMSPEQCGDEVIAEPSDWYAFGTILYEALAGSLPFQGSVLQVLRAKREVTPVPPSQIRAGVPPDLEKMCMALLRREPDKRPTGEVVVNHFRQSGVKRPPPATPRTFVGRRHELQLLLAQLEDSRQGRRTVTLVRGPSGIGKSSLLRQFLDETHRRHPETLLLSGRCYEQESVPYKALDPVIDELARRLAALPEAEMAPLCPDDSASLVELFPVLRQVAALSRARGVLRMEPAAKRSRGASALRQLLSRVAGRRPVVIAVDDLQWGDVDSAMLLAELTRPPDPPPVCFVGCYRGEEAATSPLLKRLSELRSSLLAEVPLREAALGELAREDAQELASLLLQEQRGDPARIAAESQGNPFFVHELARLGDAGVALPEVVELRVARLPEPARRLLQAVAVAGLPIDDQIAGDAAGVESGARDLLATLRAEHLVRGRDQDAQHRVECYHDRIREAVVRSLDRERLRELHRRLAEAMERHDHDPEVVLLHWREAGEPLRAAALMVVAAERAAAALAFEREAHLYREALALRGDDPEAPRLKGCLAEALARAGRGAEAGAAYLDAARGLAPAEAEVMRRRAAEELLGSGHIDEGVRALVELLAAAGIPWPETTRAVLSSFFWSRLRISLRGLRAGKDDSPQLLSRIDTAWVAAQGMSFVDPLRAADLLGRCLLWALQAGEPLRLARILVGASTFEAFAGIPGEKRSLRYRELAAQLVERSGNLQERGRLMLSGGVTSFLFGRWKEARARLEEGDELVRQNCKGMTWELDSAQVFLAESLYVLGDLLALEKLFSERLRDAEGRGDLYAAVTLRAGSATNAWLARDDPDGALAVLEDGIRRWSVAGFHVQHFYDLQSRTQIDLYRRDGEGALRRLEEAAPRLKSSLLLRGQSLRVKWADLQARSLLCARSDAASLKRVESLAQGILRETLPWATPIGQLLLGQVALRRNDKQRAEDIFATAADGFAAADMPSHQAAARRARGLILADGGAIVESAESSLSQRLVRRPDRLATLLVPAV